ncbi:hypothetical protein [Pseudoclavibacter sp. VKM Ac-2867]|uniref:hypothetical protein n=1 Tax=Pseudoclavibacter sp. VKM Ac-2867 TaxID=2783829 RepID=UPI00188D2870|nr:hypothetical protein [Pseudoclavibacter sp. VKM Ac-2867]MBF4459489.1 hypothetical protein [Pseudoclavibacter sp. VKM Ac-2867]
MTILTTDRPAQDLADLPTLDYTDGYRAGLRAAHRELTEARDRALDNGDDATGYTTALDDLALLLLTHGIPTTAPLHGQADDDLADDEHDDEASGPTPNFIGFGQ